MRLNQTGEGPEPEERQLGFCERILESIKGQLAGLIPSAQLVAVYSAAELPRGLAELVRNPVYVSMVVGWIFGSYLVGGYGTYLPKFIETQYGQTAAMADVYSGFPFSRLVYCDTRENNSIAWCRPDLDRLSGSEHGSGRLSSHATQRRSQKGHLLSGNLLPVLSKSVQV